MKMNAIGYLLRLYFLWLAFFAVGRAVFIIYLPNDSSGIGDLLLSFLYGWIMDTSMACYLLAFPLLLTIVSIFGFKKLICQILNVYHWILLVVISFMVVVEIPLFEAWGFKLHIKSAIHLAHPGEMFRTASWGQTFAVLGGTGLLSGGFIWIYHKVVRPLLMRESHRTVLQGLSITLLGLPLLVLGIRGGFQQIPLQQSDVYFSSSNLANNAAVNTPWNFIHSYIENKHLLNGHPYQYTDPGTACATVASLTEDVDTNDLLTNSRPNIVLVILESWGADMVERLGGAKGLTPHFSKLCDNGLLFTNFYASGERSDQGICTILSGFPAQPTTSIISQPAKMRTLPALNKELDPLGYQSLFVFGGQLNYGNIRSYLVYNNYHKIVEEQDFESDEGPGKLGYHDRVVFNRFLSEINELHPPFFANMFTLSTHEPFDIPEDTDARWDGEYPKYANAMLYADQHLGKFMDQAKKQPWYDNTLFVFVADHGHHSYKHWNFFEPNYRKIPLLFYGKPLQEKYKGVHMNIPGCQSDIAPTLMAAMKLDPDQYKWGKNLLDSSANKYAYYSHLNGFGWVSTNGYVVYHHQQKKVMLKSFDNEADLGRAEDNGKAYLQCLMDYYIAN